MAVLHAVFSQSLDNKHIKYRVFAVRQKEEKKKKKEEKKNPKIHKIRLLCPQYFQFDI